MKTAALWGLRPRPPHDNLSLQLRAIAATATKPQARSNFNALSNSSKSKLLTFQPSL
jgi:hypothetical protein